MPNKFSPKKFKEAHLVLSRQDPALKKLFARHKEMKFAPKMEREPFESLVRAIAHQQLHGKAAETILGRMLALFPGKKFPHFKDLLSIKDEKLRACGFSASKTKSIKDIALKTKEGVVPTGSEIVKLENEEIVERLTEIFGVGRWTVEMLLIFQLGRLDVWPVDDFGVRKGFMVWKKLKEMPAPKELKSLGAEWAPYQTLVALYLWQEANKAKK